ncbi:secreted protein [Pseudomonas graminis]|uniref:twin-arginine translocation signal domain-containing protein n=1 Tax=Pseudomonas graminis TaxID=158627 RepID=UPI0010D18F36|nr:twin-arginine translocation signal domain-containing protein [Pseudomonas graminis]TDV56701.1 secreted protein [Pseudomonas graminis]
MKDDDADQPSSSDRRRFVAKGSLLGAAAAVFLPCLPPALLSGRPTLLPTEAR